MDLRSESEVCEGFLRRQISKKTTKTQNSFDWIFGVALPLLCFAFDPFVFNSDSPLGEEWSLGAALLGAYKPFAYLLAIISIMSLSAWLLWAKRFVWLHAPLGAIFLVGGVVSLGVGILILPFSVLGLIFVVGILGFTPFFTALVFLRNAARAFSSKKGSLSIPFNRRIAALVMILGLAIPIAINRSLNAVIDEAATGTNFSESVNVLRLAEPLIDSGVLEREWNEVEDTKRKDQLRKAFVSIKGREMADEVFF